MAQIWERALPKCTLTFLYSIIQSPPILALFKTFLFNLLASIDQQLAQIQIALVRFEIVRRFNDAFNQQLGSLVNGAKNDLSILTSGLDSSQLKNLMKDCAPVITFFDKAQQAIVDKSGLSKSSNAKYKEKKLDDRIIKLSEDITGLTILKSQIQQMRDWIEQQEKQL